jgi:hypothetical protein
MEAPTYNQDHDQVVNQGEQVNKTLEERIVDWQAAFYEAPRGSGAEVEAFLSLYYLATFMASALQTAKDQLAVDGRVNTLARIDGILTQNEENR